jgi:hypothetical protein
MARVKTRVHSGLGFMDILLRFLTQTLRENQTQLQLSEMRKKQM